MYLSLTVGSPDRAGRLNASNMEFFVAWFIRDILLHASEEEPLGS